MDKQLKDKAIDIKGKKYVEVKNRVDYFNETYGNGAIHTELVKSEELFIVKAIVIPDMAKPERFYTGYSQASFNDKSDANKTAPLEVAETSAVGRALAFMGIGVIDSIASAEEMRKAQSYQKPKTFNPKPTTAPQDGQGDVCSNCGDGVTGKVAEYSKGKFGKILCYDCQRLPEIKLN